MKLVKMDEFRSAGKGVNEDYDMVRVTIDMPLKQWNIFRREGASKGRKGHNEDRLKFSSLLGRFERAIRSRNEYECDDVRKEVKEFTNEYFPKEKGA